MTQEESEAYCDWRRGPLAALPQWLTFFAAKNYLKLISAIYNVL